MKIRIIYLLFLLALSGSIIAADNGRHVHWSDTNQETHFIVDDEDETDFVGEMEPVEEIDLADVHEHNRDPYRSRTHRMNPDRITLTEQEARRRNMPWYFRMPLHFWDWATKPFDENEVIH